MRVAKVCDALLPKLERSQSIFLADNLGQRAWFMYNLNIAVSELVLGYRNEAGADRKQHVKAAIGALQSAEASLLKTDLDIYKRTT